MGNTKSPSTTSTTLTAGTPDPLDPSQITIIVVDDSDFTRSNLIQFLRQQKYNVVADFGLAKPALDYLAANVVHLALVDIVMPQVSGLELTQKISQNISRTKVIVMSSLAQERIILEAISVGAQDFLSKPINPQHLEDSIQRIINGKSQAASA